ncbi:MAG: [protein-PII] uridylyltransferase [Geminicoccaceae bacterium]
MATALEPRLLDFTRLRAEIAHFQGVEGNPTSGLLEQLREELQAGRAEIRGGFEAGAGAEQAMRELCQQMDGLIQGILDFGLTRLYGTPNPTTGEQLAVAAVGGYGRKELAPGSDIDLLFLCHYKRTAHVEQMAEFLLYKLWDLGLKVGQSVRSLDECVKLARNDLTVRTALLEARLLWGSPQLFGQLEASFASEIIAGNEARFVEEKLAERDRRHQRMGDSRFLLEPNIKEGKGGLRDLQTLTWIGRFLFHSGDPAELVRQNLLTRPALRMFLRAHRFLWTVRCHLHYLTDRAEDRLTFDLQPEVARRMGFRERNKVRAVERFMKRYYLVAREVGTATRIFCAALEERHQRVSPLARLGFGRRRINGFVIQGNRLNLGEPTLFEREPVRMLELFHLAQERELDIHPQALAAVTHTLSRVDVKLRTDPEANRLFLDILCARKHPALALTRMNEVGLLGRFVPEFGRIVAQMQHNLYHIYTVDEHTIRAIDILSQIERGELGEELPLSTEVMPKLLSRREIYVATFLHDIAKGRGGDHSVLGEQIAKKVCPRLGLSDDATETVAWLVRQHLVMSRFAFKRDSEDPQTIADFVSIVQSPERLKLLLVLTVTDIRAVGPNVWNGWKGQLLRELYQEAMAAMAAGDPQGRRARRIERAQRKLAEALGELPEGPWPAEAIEAYLARHDPRYWLGFLPEEQLRHAQVVRQADATRTSLAMDFRTDEFRARTEILLYAADHPGLFMKVAGALALSGVSIVDAHIFTTADGMALDTLGFQDATSRLAVTEQLRLDRIRDNIIKALSGEIWLEKALAGRRSLPKRADVFEVEPRVLIDNTASRTHSVIEVNGRDRPGLLFELARTLKDLGLVIHSAHVSTYGERVVDVFYVKDVFGLKIAHRSKMQRVHKQLADVLAAR